MTRTSVGKGLGGSPKADGSSKADGSLKADGSPAGGFRQAMSWLHTWVGLTLGWVLFFIFLTGTVGYFDTEIDRWMQPELPQAQTLSLIHI